MKSVAPLTMQCDLQHNFFVSFLNFIEQSKIPKSKGFPPFEKGGPGGISKPIHLKNPPRSPFSKGGSIIFIYELIEFKKDTFFFAIG